MSKGITIAEETKVVNILPPVDVNGAGSSGDYFTMANHSHASIILQLGVTGAAAGVLVSEATSSTAAGKTAINFDYYAEETAAGDTLGTRTATTNSTGFETSTEDSVMYVIEIDASQLSDGSDWICVELDDPSAATLFSGVAILSGSRYAQAVQPTAIA